MIKDESHESLGVQVLEELVVLQFAQEDHEVSIHILELPKLFENFLVEKDDFGAWVVANDPGVALQRYKVVSRPVPENGPFAHPPKQHWLHDALMRPHHHRPMRDHANSFL